MWKFIVVVFMVLAVVFGAGYFTGSYIQENPDVQTVQQLKRNIATAEKELGAMRSNISTASRQIAYLTNQMALVTGEIENTVPVTWTVTHCDRHGDYDVYDVTIQSPSGMAATFEYVNKGCFLGSAVQYVVTYDPNGNVTTKPVIVSTPTIAQL